MQKLWLLHFARHLLLIAIHVKFREDILNNLHVIEWTRFFGKAQREISPKV